jgi:GNAT superfamily N-acetyltransferase
MGFQVRGLQRYELDDFLLCFQASFGVDDLSLSIIRNSLINDPYFTPDKVRVGVLDGEIISHVVILHRPAWAGKQVITTAGITAVATHPRFQGQGYGSRVARDAVKMVRRKDYDLAILTTRVPGFFARLGFIEAPAVLGYQCPATGLSRMTVPEEYTLQRLDYHEMWPALAAVYREYSEQRTGMQVREDRFWETWPLRGTFPIGFSREAGSVGFVAMVGDASVAYLGAQDIEDMPYLAVTEFAHRNDHAGAALGLLKTAALRYLTKGGRRVVIRAGRDAPVLNLLEEQAVPIDLDVGQGLMVMVTNKRWVKPAGFRNVDDALQNLFFADPPAMWHRDGY